MKILSSKVIFNFFLLDHPGLKSGPKFCIRIQLQCIWMQKAVCRSWCALCGPSWLPAARSSSASSTRNHSPGILYSKVGRYKSNLPIPFTENTENKIVYWYLIWRVSKISNFRLIAIILFFVVDTIHPKQVNSKQLIYNLFIFYFLSYIIFSLT